MASEHRDRRTYVLTPPPQNHVEVDIGEPSIIDGWLVEFDAKLAGLSARQDAFFERLGIEVVAAPEEPPERMVEVYFEGSASTEG